MSKKEHFNQLCTVDNGLKNLTDSTDSLKKQVNSVCQEKYHAKGKQNLTMCFNKQLQSVETLRLLYLKHVHAYRNKFLQDINIILILKLKIIYK